MPEWQGKQKAADKKASSHFILCFPFQFPGFKQSRGADFICNSNRSQSIFV
jgi:hypothetical protein